MSDNTNPFLHKLQELAANPYTRQEPTVQLCLNDAELAALQVLLESVPVVQNLTLMPVLIDIRTGNYVTLDG